MINRIKNELRHGKIFLTFAGLKTFNRGLAALIPMLLAAFLAPAGFGSYSLSIMVIYFFSSILLGSSRSPFIVLASEEYKNTGRISRALSSRIVIIAGSIVLFIIMAFLFMDPLSQFAAISQKQFLFLMFAYFGMGLGSFIDSMLMGLNRRITSTIYGLVNALISISYLLILYFYFTITLELIFLMFLISPIITCTIMFRNMGFSKAFPLKLDYGMVKKMLSYTKWTMFGGAALYFINWGDNIVLKYFVTLEEIGVYNLGYQFFKGMILLISTTQAYFLPFISQNIGDKKIVRNYLYRKRPRILLLGLLGILVLFVLVPFLIKVAYGPVYSKMQTSETAAG